MDKNNLPAGYDLIETSNQLLPIDQNVIGLWDWSPNEVAIIVTGDNENYYSQTADAECDRPTHWLKPSTALTKEGEVVTDNSKVIANLASLNEGLRNRCDMLMQEAQIKAQKANAANATLNEIYQAVSGGAGEKANWNGAKPVVDKLAEMQAEIDRLQFLSHKEEPTQEPSPILAPQTVTATSEEMANRIFEIMSEGIGGSVTIAGDAYMELFEKVAQSIASMCAGIERDKAVGFAEYIFNNHFHCWIVDEMGGRWIQGDQPYSESSTTSQLYDLYLTSLKEQ